MVNMAALWREWGVRVGIKQSPEGSESEGQNPQSVQLDVTKVRAWHREQREK